MPCERERERKKERKRQGKEEEGGGNRKSNKGSWSFVCVYVCVCCPRQTVHFFFLCMFDCNKTDIKVLLLLLSMYAKRLI